ncbi:MAG: hypothetical protein WC511_00205 [Candidatus Pacearchaeota archaeon]
MEYNLVLISEFLSEEFREARREYNHFNSKGKILFWEEAVRKGELEEPTTIEQEKYNNTFRNAMNDID